LALSWDGWLAAVKREEKNNKDVILSYNNIEDENQ
jgi:hypothetical protein